MGRKRTTVAARLTEAMMSSDKVRFAITLRAEGDFCFLHGPQVSFLVEDRVQPRAQLVYCFDKLMPWIVSARAIQGHSSKTAMAEVHRPLPCDVKILLHGTKSTATSSIENSGLIPGGNGRSGRTENYFSTKDPNDPSVAKAGDIPGYRYAAELTLTIDGEIAAGAGCRFFVTASNAVLCREKVPPAAFLQMVRFYDKEAITTYAQGETLAEHAGEYLDDKDKHDSTRQPEASSSAAEQGETLAHIEDDETDRKSSRVPLTLKVKTEERSCTKWGRMFARGDPDVGHPRPVHVAANWYAFAKRADTLRAWKFAPSKKIQSLRLEPMPGASVTSWENLGCRTHKQVHLVQNTSSGNRRILLDQHLGGLE